MCGRNTKLVVTAIEGSQMNVCENCSRFGKVLGEKQITEKKPARKKLPEIEKSFEMIDRDFARIVKEARDRLGLEQHQLADKIAEKESVIHRIEAGLLEPPIKLAKKFEIALRIKLIVLYTDEPANKVNFKSEALTIGDLIKGKK